MLAFVLTILVQMPEVDAHARLMPAVIERFRVDRSDLQRFHDVPLSRRGVERMRRFFTEWQDGLRSFDFEGMARADQVDFLLLHNEVRHELSGLEHALRRISETEAIAPFVAGAIELEERRRDMEPLDSKAAAAALDAIAAAAADALEALRRPAEGASPLQPSLAKRAADDLASVHRTVDHWFRAQDGYDPLFSWWCASPHQRAVDKMAALEDHLRREVAGLKGGMDDPLVGDPVGREVLLDLLAAEMIPYTPEELVDIAEREFAWCEQELVRAAREMGLDDDWRTALERVKELHAAPGGQDELIEDLAREAIEFVEARELVTVPELCKETWRIEMMAPERQRTAPFFLYGGQHILVSYPTDDMTHAQKLMSMRANNEHFSRATVQHELIPGHHLQGFMAARHAAHRRPFSTPFLGEGWCLHWEMLLWDLGFPRGPEDRIGMLFWRSHRCARVLVSLGFHLGTMTPAEMIELLVDRVGHERDSATAEVRRYIGGDYGPLYQCAYLLGGLQIRALHRELVGGGRMSQREFHDAVLREGSIPVDMIRAALTEVPLARDYRPTWRF